MDHSRPTPVPLVASRASPLTLVVLAGYAVWLVAGYWETVASMVSIWYRSETFAHGFVIFPISLWLVWRKRFELARLEPEPRVAPLPLLTMLGAGVLWLLGDLADVLAAVHYAWITMLVAGVWMLVGDAVARRLLFPLAFLYFAVPVGEFLLPTLIEWTADFTIAALRATGVPVWREGMTFQIPTGAWSIVEACGGLRYLIASVTVGVLYAYLAYRSPLRRGLFVAASVIVPIVANWLRAYLIVMIGHLSGNRLAVGVDHIIYGWIFFGVVILLLFWVGSFWREDERDNDGASRDDAELPVARGDSPPLSRWGAVLAVAIIVSGAAPAAVRILAGDGVPGAIDASAPPLGDWRPVPGSFVEWTPEFTTPRATIASTYAHGDAQAAAYVALYFDQDRDSKLVSSANHLIRTGRNGRVIADRQRTVDGGDGPLAVQESVLRIRDQRVLARTWYWIDGEYTASPARAKLAQAKARLGGRGDAGAIVVVYAPLPAEGPAQSEALDDFTRKAAAALRPILAERLRGGHAR